MRFVPVTSAEMQAGSMDLSARDLLIRQRTQPVLAVRGHAAEFGVIAAKGVAQVEPLLERVAGPDMPQAAKQTPAQLSRRIAQLDAQWQRSSNAWPRNARPTRSADARRRSPASGRSRR